MSINFRFHRTRLHALGFGAVLASSLLLTGCSADSNGGLWAKIAATNPPGDSKAVGVCRSYFPDETGRTLAAGIDSTLEEARIFVAEKFKTPFEEAFGRASGNSYIAICYLKTNSPQGAPDAEILIAAESPSGSTAFIDVR